MSQPLVSVIIPTHNRKAMAIRLLKSILGSTYKNIEVIVVDDASVDGTSGAIKKAFSGNEKIHLVINKINRYVAGSRNEGTKIAKGKYFFYIDDDNVVERRAIEELVRAFEQDDRIGELGLVNMSFKNRQDVLWLAVRRNMWTTKTDMKRNLHEYRGETVWESEDVHNAFIIRASVIKKHGISFCEKFGIMYEASDVAYRIQRAGYLIKVVRDAVIYHDVDDSLYHFMADNRVPYLFARNRIIFHFLYSTKLQLVGILCLWIWVFMFYYWYEILRYRGEGDFSLLQKMQLVISYFGGTVAGIMFVIRGERLTYPRIT